MSDALNKSTDLGHDLAELSAGLAVARRQLTAGRPAPMRDLAQELNRLLGQAASASTPPPGDTLVSLLAEVDHLIEALEQGRSRLAADLKGQGERRGALRAYRPNGARSHG